MNGEKNVIHVTEFKDVYKIIDTLKCGEVHFDIDSSVPEATRINALDFIKGGVYGLIDEKIMVNDEETIYSLKMQDEDLMYEFVETYMGKLEAAYVQVDETTDFISLLDIYKSGRKIVLDLSDVDESVGRQVFNLFTGCSYSLWGKVSKKDSIYEFSPSVVVTSKLSWMNEVKNNIKRINELLQLDDSEEEIEKLYIRNIELYEENEFLIDTRMVLADYLLQHKKIDEAAIQLDKYLKIHLEHRLLTWGLLTSVIHRRMKLVFDNEGVDAVVNTVKHYTHICDENEDKVYGKKVKLRVYSAALIYMVRGKRSREAIKLIKASYKDYTEFGRRDDVEKVKLICAEAFFRTGHFLKATKVLRPLLKNKDSVHCYYEALRLQAAINKKRGKPCAGLYEEFIEEVLSNSEMMQKYKSIISNEISILANHYSKQKNKKNYNRALELFDLSIKHAMNDECRSVNIHNKAVLLLKMNRKNEAKECFFESLHCRLGNKDSKEEAFSNPDSLIATLEFLSDILKEEKESKE